MTRRLMGCIHGADDPSSRFRFLQYMPHLRRAGWMVEHRPCRPPRPWVSPLESRVLRVLHRRLGRGVRRLNRWLDVAAAARCNVVMVHRDLLGQGMDCERLMQWVNPRIIYDLDDALFLGKAEVKIRWLCEHAAWVLAGNEYLAEWCRGVAKNVTVLPTVVDTDRYVLPVREWPIGRPRVGWCGSPGSIRETLFPFVDMFARLQARLGFEFVVMTRPRPELPPCNLRWSYAEWSEEAERRLGDHMDIGVMPLVDNAFQQGKCGLKVLLYMAMGLPAVASPVGVNTRIVRHGETGFLADGEDEWEWAIGELMDASELRRRVRVRARADCEERYSVRAWLPVLLDVLDRVSDGGRG